MSKSIIAQLSNTASNGVSSSLAQAPWSTFRYHYCRKQPTCIVPITMGDGRKHSIFIWAGVGREDSDSDCMFLDPSRIHIACTRDGAERMSLIRIVREGGATREGLLKPQVTHIVVSFLAPGLETCNCFYYQCYYYCFYRCEGIVQCWKGRALSACNLVCSSLKTCIPYARSKTDRDCIDRGVRLRWRFSEVSGVYHQHPSFPLASVKPVTLYAVHCPLSSEGFQGIHPPPSFCLVRPLW
jgi:hypothetical protein